MTIIAPYIRALWITCLIRFAPIFGSSMARAQTPAAEREVQYLMFQLFTAGPGFTTVEVAHVLTKLPDPALLDPASLLQILKNGGTLGKMGKSALKTWPCNDQFVSRGSAESKVPVGHAAWRSEGGTCKTPVPSERITAEIRPGRNKFRSLQPPQPQMCPVGRAKTYGFCSIINDLLLFKEGSWD